MSKPGKSRPVVDVPGGNVALDLFVVGQHLGALLDQALLSTGISASQYAVYSLLGQRRQTPGELSAVSGIKPTTLSGYLVTLERRGHLRRARNADDGRSVVLDLTDDGRAKLEECRPLLAGCVRQINRRIGNADRVSQGREWVAVIDHAILGALEGSTNS